LLDDFADLLVIAGDIEHIGVEGLGFREDGFEVLVFLEVGFFADYLPAVGGEGGFEDGGEAFAVVAGVVDHDGDFAGAEAFAGEVGADFALEGVDEAGAEGVVFDFAGFFVDSDFGVDGGGGDEGDFVGFGNGRGGDAAGADGEADDGGYFVLGDDLAMALVDSEGSPLLSAVIISSCLPRTPPAALISLKASLEPLAAEVP
jgi:hypothetical protein